MRFRERSPLVWAIWFSLLAHAVLLTLHFQPELKALKDQIPSLKVMLVNSKTRQAPEKADALAQANLDRGGNTDEKRQMKSPLPSVQKMPATTPQATEATMQPAIPATPQDAELQRHQQRVAQLEQEAQALLTQLKASQAVTSVQALPLSQTQAATRKPAPQALNQPVQTQQEIMALQEMAKLEALIAKQQDAYEMRPKRQFIGARTREYRFASYVDQWRQKIEQVGNLNYPEAARTQKLYGKLQLTVAIRADGSIESIKIQQSSGKRLLDESARRIVQLAAPFPAFPENIRKDTDVLSITRTWTFSKEDQLSTE
ncbi:MAG: TonB family protein [Methylophilus sp.]|uniref:energy transducer TonB n=1 Tax=Methylophilus sp. TaxID=29541 RepID=UPI002CC93A17|nr:TonB family protein [Methylophilus sp.]HSH86924.1 TonB family protein [Methylophilus sp.]